MAEKAMKTGSNISDAIPQIRSAWQNNRMIVPLIGAGISADSGIPIVRSIVRYFGKFQQMIEHKAYLVRGTGDAKALVDAKIGHFTQRPWDFVKRFGWPDRFQLNQDLLALTEECGGKDGIPATVGEAARTGIERALKHINPLGEANFELSAAGNKRDVETAPSSIAG